jgi:hypothetical protein
MVLLKLRAVPFIETSGTEEAKKLLSTPFTFSMLTNSFDDWSFKDKGTYSNYINKTDSRIVIESYSIGYSLNNGKSTHAIPTHPLTIDQFITDCQRAGIELFWSEAVLGVINYQQLLSGSDIKKYHVTLLHRIEKSDDLL